ncbi:CidA/LrgA family protein [Pseudorhodoferax sp. Leaf267]|uniref:CidA/LrgA family protein n=1 Tax=Pseudorhodoferax sp. Leaf267 TaxID=1736316 RepID=UPI0006F9DABB|nr:CidA/LrgA family protein [Pseudorhodoferax sp. Leaf267]KQP23497.1 murein hydrolase transporter LrgA [Pseudorhodoferax sp. Leaf267]
MIRTLAGALALVLFLLLGEAIVRWSGLPVPGSLVGMVLLLAALIAWGRTPPGLQAASTPLLRHLMLFFIPAVAGVMTQFALVADEWLPFLAACALGAALTLAVTALALRWSLRRFGQGPQ